MERRPRTANHGRAIGIETPTRMGTTQQHRPAPPWGGRAGCLPWAAGGEHRGAGGACPSRRTPAPRIEPAQPHRTLLADQPGCGKTDYRYPAVLHYGRATRGYLLTGGTTAARPGLVEVVGGSLSFAAVHSDMV